MRRSNYGGSNSLVALLLFSTAIYVLASDKKVSSLPKSEPKTNQPDSSIKETESNSSNNPIEVDIVAVKHYGLIRRGIKGLINYTIKFWRFIY